MNMNMDTHKNLLKMDDSFTEKENNLKYANIIEELLKRQILVKLKKGTTLFVDGRIIKFSELLKFQSATSNFDYKLNLENVDRKDLAKICEYLAIIEYNKSDYIEDIKAEELNSWYIKNKEIMPEIHNVNNYYYQNKF